LWHAQIQVWLKAAAIKWKRLAKAYLRLLRHQIGLESLKNNIWRPATNLS
jgi:hypothetical protein